MKINYFFRVGLLFATIALPNLMSAGSKETYTFDISRTVDDADVPTVCELNTSIYEGKWRLLNDDDIEEALKDDVLKLYGIQLSSGSYYEESTSTTSSYGHWFTNKGIVAQYRSGYIESTYNIDSFSIIHKSGRFSLGDQVTFKQALVANSDTIEYVFNVTFAEVNSVTSDQPEGFIGGRESAKDRWNVIPVMYKNDEAYTNQNYIQVMAGDKISLEMKEKNEGDAIYYSVRNSAGTTIRSLRKASVFELTDNADSTYNGYYTVTTRVTDSLSKVTVRTMYVYVDVQTEEEGTRYNWAEHTPKFSYDFHDEYGDIPMPENVLDDCGTSVAGRYSDRWWTVVWGNNRNPLIDGSEDGTDETGGPDNMYKNMLEKYNTDFEYIRENMGWPPDKRARRGYKSTICVYGSGLSTDNADNTATGGWQSATYYNGESWPMVLASYYPISRFADDADSKYTDGEYQREAMIHEGIHAIFADMDGVKKSAWFHEAGNTWLQSAMNTERDGVYGTPGYLDACPFIAPFMPIECYSGWLQDGSFGGPAAEGVNMYNSDGSQVCTWRTLLGGNQYGNAFPIVLGEICGKGSIPWIWRYCSTYVLAGIADSIGEQPMRSLILQYRARQATFDIGGWATGYRQITSGYLGYEVGPEWEPYWIDCGKYALTPYATLTRNDNEGWLAPDTLTNPGWSGSNIIPIHVQGDRCQVEFLPEDTEMRAQLCYRTKSGDIYYSQPVHCGTLTMDMTDAEPANGVIFCVVANTDYIYTGDAQRKKHFDYRIKLGENALATADPYKGWYFYENNIVDDDFETGIESVQDESVKVTSKKGVLLGSGVFRGGDKLNITLNGVNAEDVQVHIVGLPGIIAANDNLTSQGTYTLPYNLPHGTYFITFSYGKDKQDVYKVYIQ